MIHILHGISPLVIPYPLMHPSSPSFVRLIAQQRPCKVLQEAETPVWLVYFLFYITLSLTFILGSGPSAQLTIHFISRFLFCTEAFMQPGISPSLSNCSLCSTLATVRYFKAAISIFFLISHILPFLSASPHQPQTISFKFKTVIYSGVFPTDILLKIHAFTDTHLWELLNRSREFCCWWRIMFLLKGTLIVTEVVLLILF